MRFFSSSRWARYRQVSRIALALLIALASSQLMAQAQGKERPVAHSISYRTIQIDGLSIFYREAGPKVAPTILLLIADVRASVRPAFRSLSPGRAGLSRLRPQRLAGPEKIRVYV
jgi:hypothetical protein